MSASIQQAIERLLQYGLQKNLITTWDVDFARNQLLDALALSEGAPASFSGAACDAPVDILAEILDWAAAHGRLAEDTVTYRDLLDTKLMGCLAPRPAEVVRAFYAAYDVSPESATQAFYQLAQDVHYIRTDRIARNEHWYSPTDYGRLEITINLSKPEKDPKAIAAAKKLQATGYPQCVLCKENVGYAGRVNQPARQNLRVIPLELLGEEWFLQFSPYVYYHEHAIVLKAEHEPMKISSDTFARLLEFVEKFPHYFLGSNADLPIVGGSILSHDHFQGGHHEFPMAKAAMEHAFRLQRFPAVRAGTLEWPMSVIRLQGEERRALVQAATSIFAAWQEYSDPQVDIIAHSDGRRHNTVTPIARRQGDRFELDLVLRNNRTSDAHPLGIFHPHQDVHHIKKENIGLIEVMGLAVLPGRLKEELRQLAGALVRDDYAAVIEANDAIAKHGEWAASVKAQHGDVRPENVAEILQQEVGRVYATILEDAGVFKRDQAGTAAFARFIAGLP